MLVEDGVCWNDGWIGRVWIGWLTVKILVFERDCEEKQQFNKKDDLLLLDHACWKD